MALQDDIHQVLKTSSRIAVLTGSGVSAESGVPTFRGSEGLWRNFDPSELATPEAFRSDPHLVWEWYDWRRTLISRCVPNVAHDAIARLEARTREFLLVTQNVDGLHRLAGNRNIAEIHGNIWRVRREDGEGPESEDRRAPLPSSAITLRDAEGHLLRPAVVWFGEPLASEALSKLRLFFAEKIDILLVVGTSGMINWVPGLIVAARDRGTIVVEVNTESTTLTHFATHSLRGKASRILPALVDGAADYPGSSSS